MTFADPRLRDDDLAYAVRTAATVPNLAHHTVPGSPATVYYAGFEGLSALPVTDAPNVYMVTASIKRAVLDPVAYGLEALDAWIREQEQADVRSNTALNPLKSPRRDRRDLRVALAGR